MNSTLRVFLHEPVHYYSRIGSRLWKGLNYHLIEDISLLARFAPEYVDGKSLVMEHLGPDKVADPWTSCIDLIGLDHVDVCAIALSFRFERFRIGDYIMPHLFYKGKLLTVLEYENRAEENNLWQTIWEFTRVLDPLIWLGILVTMFVIAVVVFGYFQLLGMTGLGVGTVFERLLRLILNQEQSELFSPRFQARAIVQFLLFIWALMSLLLSELFAGSIMSVTSLKAGYQPPFHNLQTMAESGYKFTIRSPSLWTKRLNTFRNQVRKFASPEDYAYLQEALDSPYVHRALVLHSNETREFDIKRAGHKLAYSANSDETPSCQFHALTLLVSLNNTFYQWPQDFSSPHSSFVVTRRIPGLVDKLNRASMRLRSTGNLLALENRFKPIRERILTKPLYQFCISQSRTKLQVLPYSNYSAKMAQFYSTFSFWILLNVVALGLGFLEIVSNTLVDGRELKDGGRISSQALREDLLDWAAANKEYLEVDRCEGGEVRIRFLNKFE